MKVSQRSGHLLGADKLRGFLLRWIALSFCFPCLVGSVGACGLHVVCGTSGRRRSFPCTLQCPCSFAGVCAAAAPPGPQLMPSAGQLGGCATWGFPIAQRGRRFKLQAGVTRCNTARGKQRENQ